jgi:microcin C transport system substrate-binding protein
VGTFDNCNMFVSGAKGNLVAGIGYVYDTLLTASLDEVSSEYALLAQAATYPEDFSSVTYRLRPDARWHDGRPVTPADVVFSFDAFKAHSPRMALYYRRVRRAEVAGERDVLFSFDTAGNRELPLIVGQLYVLPRHWWVAEDGSSTGREVAATTLEPPLGSGPYRLARLEPGRTVIYQRVADYWARALNVQIGCNNFDELRFEYFRDPTAAFESFKAGDADWRVENSAKVWVVGYSFPAVARGRVVREEFPIRDVGVMQAFAFNLRRKQFQDARVRRAFNFALDFESLNRNVFYGQYQRISSYFQGTELAASGIPLGEELRLLETVRRLVPSEVFMAEYRNPIGGSSSAVRQNLRQALRLFNAAGFVIRRQRLVDSETDRPLVVELLLDDPAYERVALPYKDALRRLGIAVTVRLVDSAQYQNRLRQWDFDIVMASWTQSLSPGNEQRDFWGSHAADVPGSRNLIGIRDQAVDMLIERVVFARNRRELVTASRALDRVLLWNHYVVPQWLYDKVRSAHWAKLRHPAAMPRYGGAAFPTIWWSTT